MIMFITCKVPHIFLLNFQSSIIHPADPGVGRGDGLTEAPS